MGLIEWLLGEEPSIFEQMLHDDKGELAEYLIEYAVSHDNIVGYTRVLKKRLSADLIREDNRDRRDSLD